MQKWAQFSADQRHRFTLGRRWDPMLPTLGFVMLNPSTADADKNDPTIIRDIGFADRLGFGGIVVGNLFSYRATKPADLRQAGYPVHRDDDEMLERIMCQVRTVVCGWGANPVPEERVDRVMGIIRGTGVEVKCLGRTKRGAPRHPLFVPYSQALEDF